MRSQKSPSGRQRIGGFFDVQDFTPGTVAQKRMSELMGDHIMREGFGTVRQLQPQHDTTCPTARRAWGRHEQSPAFTGNVVVDRHSKPRILQKILLHLLRNGMQNREHSLTQFRMVFKFGNQ